MNNMAVRGLDPLDEGALRLLQKKIRVLMNDHADRVATGACRDFADYRYSVGIIEGLALAERELLDLIELQERGTS